jgi:formate-dependent nitrite reductase membrane component NrfD
VVGSDPCCSPPVLAAAGLPVLAAAGGVSAGLGSVDCCCCNRSVRSAL